MMDIMVARFAKIGVAKRIQLAREQQGGAVMRVMRVVKGCY